MTSHINYKRQFRPLPPIPHSHWHRGDEKHSIVKLYMTAKILKMGIVFIHRVKPTSRQNILFMRRGCGSCPYYIHATISSTTYWCLVARGKQYRLGKARLASDFNLRFLDVADISWSRSSDFTCPVDGAWAEKALAEQELELETAGAVAYSGPLCTAENISEKCTIAAGRKKGIKITQTFDEACVNAKNKC